MKSTTHWLAAASFAITACAPPTRVQTSSQLDGPWGDVQFAYVQLDTLGGTDGDPVTVESIILTNDPDHCATADPDGFPGGTDVAFVVVGWAAIVPPVGRASATAWLLPGSVDGPGDVAMAGRAWWLDDGEYKVRAQPECCGTTPDIAIDITSRSPQGNLEAGTFEIRLEQDIGTARPLDTDVNGDGMPDHRAINERLTGRFDHVQVCP